MSAASVGHTAWPTEALRAAVSPLLPGFTVEVLPSIDSTNTELMRRARSGQCTPALLVTERQTAGRGRMGRTWLSDPDWHSDPDRNSRAGAGAGAGCGAGAIASLLLSLGLPLAPRDWSGLSLAVGVSLAESLQPMPLPSGQGQGTRLGLKWPNDLWLDGATGERKLGGILVETASFVASPGASRTSLAGIGGSARYVVIGIGINMLPRSAEGLSMPPGSLQELEPGLLAPAALLRIVPPLVAMLQTFEAHGFAPMQARFAARDLLQGRAVTLSDGRSGSAHGVAQDGALLVRMAGGMQAITSADISVRPAC